MKTEDLVKIASLADGQRYPVNVLVTQMGLYLEVYGRGKPVGSQIVDWALLDLAGDPVSMAFHELEALITRVDDLLREGGR